MSESSFAKPPAVPLVSVGFPVFNGERYLDDALSSLVAQDYPHLEIIISDNASTDRTAEICARYIERDKRIRYERAPSNQGAAWNFTRVFQRARGTYFMWAAHDDLWEPACVRSCVERLEADPAAVVCHPASQPITASFGIPVGAAYLGEEFRNEGETVRERWIGAVRKASLHAAVYGVIRRSALEKVRPFQVCVGSDAVLIAELSLHGKIVGLSQPLSKKRVPDNLAEYRTDAEMLEYLGARKPGAPRFPFAAIFREMNRGLRFAGLDPDLTRRLARDTWTIYRSDIFLVADLKRFGIQAIGPRRYARWARVVKGPARGAAAAPTLDGSR